MKELISSLFFAVIAAVVPVLAKYAIDYIRQAKDRALASADDIRKRGYIEEIADTITDAVAATSQTYVDALKETGTFTKEAQKEAAQKALAACLASISPAAQSFIEAAYGNIREYMTTRIEAEVRKQKKEITALPMVGELVGTGEATVEETED